MKAFIINKYSKDEPLHLTDIPTPSIEENEVLIEIHSAGLNQLDSKIKSGEFKLILPYKIPLILGHDLAGIVLKTGSKVTRFKVGDEVYARVADFHIGTFAEYIAVNENDLALKPKNISMEEAASIPLVGLTVWQAFEKAKLRKGQKIFIQAGSGGVGSIAIQLAKHFGATVASTTSTKNVEMVKTLGADVVIDYKKENFADRVKDYDMVLHSSRDKKVIEESLRLLKSGGILITLAGPPTPEFAQELKLPWYLRILMKLLSATPMKLSRKLGVVFYFLFMKADGRQLSEITSLIEKGVIRPVIDKIFPFEQTNDALAYVETGHARGKVVVKIK